MTTFPAGPQPHPVEVERAVIGALMRDGCTPPDVPLLLRPEHFSVARHRAVWRAALALVEAGRPADPVSLKRAMVDGDNVLDLRPDLAAMAAEAAAPDTVDRYAFHIVRAFIERHVARLQEDHDRLIRTLPDNVTTEMMGA